MTDTSKVSFSAAIPRLINLINENAQSRSVDVALIRDLAGRITIAVNTENAGCYAELSETATRLLGRYLSPSPLKSLADLIDADSIFNSKESIILQETPVRVKLVDRLIIGQDWLRDPIVINPSPPRATLYSVKGGVGRSTALAVWARYLSSKGHRVFISDLDLEAPGVGSMLLPKEMTPRFGIIDWLVESGLGTASESIIEEMYARSPLSEDSEIFVLPAGGGAILKTICQNCRAPIWKFWTQKVSF